MDYCHPCRRHLNGALACPGCGAPVEELRAYAERRDVRADAGEDGAGVYDGPEDSYGEDDEADDADDADAEGADEPVGRAARRAQGRGRGRGRGSRAAGPAGAASRRDRKAAAHRRRRRRVLMITVAAVLAAGGLSLAELGVDAPFSSPKPAVAGDESVDGAASSETGGTAKPVGDKSDDGTATDAPSPGTSPSPSKSSKDKPKKDDEDKPSKDAQSSTTGTNPGTTSAPTNTAPASTPTPTSDPTTPDPPTPSPSKTCTRFLWWCS